MAKKISIAFDKSHGVLTREERLAGEQRIRDLQIDRVFRLICPDGVVRDSFLTILSHPLPTMQETLGRQEAVRIFHAHPVLLDLLIELARRLMVNKTAWDSERSRLYTMRRTNPNDAGQTLANAKQSLILTFHFLRGMMNILQEMAAAIDRFAANQGYIGRLREACVMASDGEEMAALKEFADKCEKNLANAYGFSMDFSVDEELMSDTFLLSDFQYIRQAPVKKQKSGGLFSFFQSNDKNKKSETEKKPPVEVEEVPSVILRDLSVSYGMEISAKAVTECDRYASAMTRGLYERFSDIELELYFYKACTTHIEKMEEKNIQYVYPTLYPYEENVLKFTNLSDLLLLTETLHVDSVVPNDVNTSSGGAGMLLTGKNNSGKTVYLRSVGTAVFLGQCGLPIPAEKAEMSVRRGIFTHFAKAEGELSPQSQAGRFEEEVSSLAAILDAVEPCSLLLLNETFQTTAYDEGAEGMYYILHYIASLGCGFLFVTHLTKLVEMTKGEVVLARTSDNPQTRYKVHLLSDAE